MTRLPKLNPMVVFRSANATLKNRFPARNTTIFAILLCTVCPAVAQEQAKAQFRQVGNALGEAMVVMVDEVVGDAKKKAAAAEAAEKRKQQMVERMRPAMNLELAFIRRATELTDSQRKSIAADAENALQKLAGQHNNILNGRVVLQVNGAFVQQGNAQQGDMQTVIRQTARDTAEKHLSEAQVAELKIEWEHREQAEKTALIDDILSQLDGQLRLSQQQYDELKATFESKWQHAVSIRFNGGQVFTVPSVPEELLLPLLTENQKTVWELANKATSYTYFNQSQTFFDEPLWEDAAAVKAAAKVKAEAAAKAKAEADAKAADELKAQLEAAAQAEAVQRAKQAEAAQQQAAELADQQKQLEQAAQQAAADQQAKANQ